VCRELLLGVPPNIYLLAHFHFYSLSPAFIFVCF
jgi:hypothetical protein